jgi:predicted nucleic acid-binding protein
MDYADATLLVLAEERGVRSIATIDVADFSACRLSRGQALTLVL